MGGGLDFTGSYIPDWRGVVSLCHGPLADPMVGADDGQTIGSLFGAA